MGVDPPTPAPTPNPLEFGDSWTALATPCRFAAAPAPRAGTAAQSLPVGAVVRRPRHTTAVAGTAPKHLSSKFGCAEPPATLLQGQASGNWPTGGPMWRIFVLNNRDPQTLRKTVALKMGESGIKIHNFDRQQTGQQKKGAYIHIKGNPIRNCPTSSNDGAGWWSCIFHPISTIWALRQHKNYD